MKTSENTNDKDGNTVFANGIPKQSELEQNHCLWSLKEEILCWGEESSYLSREDCIALEKQDQGKQQ